jgi:hypothetical protein
MRSFEITDSWSCSRDLTRPAQSTEAIKNFRTGQYSLADTNSQTTELTPKSIPDRVNKKQT